MFYTNCSWNFS